MDKQQFNNLSTTEQIQYINNNLDNNSLTKLCDALDLNRSTISKRFKAIGYTFDRSQNRFVVAEATEVQQNNNNYVTIEQYNSLEKQIKALEDKYNKLSVTIEKQQNNNCTTEVQQNNNSNEIRFYKNEVVVRAHRIDREVYNRFKAFTDSNKQYKISDIISTALENFLNEYDK